jgi:UDP-N-acetylglucosamine 2-epimerase (hydrolysing)
LHSIIPMYLPTTAVKKKILFISGTRADFGKIKSLIEITRTHPLFDVRIFVTGMHMHNKYGYTLNEIRNCGYEHIYSYINFTSETTMDLTLAKTIEGLSNYIKEFPPDMMIVHGDRVEALAGAIVGSLNNILVAHIEGGEVSGTIDELIRHSVSKMSHIHFVSNETARRRLLQMGEDADNVFVIGSPDIDIMFSNELPLLPEVKRYYEIEFEKYGVVMFHPVTTEAEKMEEHAENFVHALVESRLNYIVIYPNNDLGSTDILRAYKPLLDHPKFRIFPSLRFEYFLVLLKNAQLLVGNSSAGIREAPYYNLPSVNIGTRQNNRALNEDIINCNYEKKEILNAIYTAINHQRQTVTNHFGDGQSDKLFLEIVTRLEFWQTPRQKFFKDVEMAG